MAARQFRVGGSRWTTFEWDGQPIAHLNQLAHTSPTAVATPVAIQPLDARRPLEVITPNAIGMGTLVLEVVELYGSAIWQELVSLAATVEAQGNITNNSNQATPTAAGESSNNGTDLADIFNAIASTADPISVVKYVQPPQGSKVSPYYTHFFNCVISDFQDDETITIGTMQIYKQLTINYTHYVQNNISS